MAKYVVFFAGSGQEVLDQKHIYKKWGEMLKERDGYTLIYNDGVGVNKGSNWLAKKFDVAATSGITGRGWAIAIEESMDQIKPTPEQIIVVGMSRGGVQAVIFAHCLKFAYPSAKVFIFAIDPVDGGHITNEGSFDMRDDRNVMARLGFKGTRGTLKTKYALNDNASKIVPDNVKFYLSVLAQFKGSTRKMWGFTPQVPTIGNVAGNFDCSTVPFQILELPGDHGYGVYTGMENGKYDKSREARSKVTTEMFFHYLKLNGFTKNRDPGFIPFKALDYYCLISIEDLYGSQGQGNSNKSGFSFLKSSRMASSKWGNSFNANINNPWHKGRGHLVPSTQAIGGTGYFVNQRHREIYDELKKAILVFFPDVINRNYERVLVEWHKRHSYILPWIAENRKFASHCEADNKSFEDFIQAFENLF